MNFAINVVSLATDAGRRKNISEMFERLDLPFSFIDTVYGKNLSAGEYYPLCSNPNFFFNRRHIISPAEVGCRLSHKCAISNFLSQTQASWLFVFEDDIILREPEFSALLNHLDQLPVNEPKVIHLGGQEGITQANRVLRLKKDGPEKLAMKRVFMPTVRWLYRTCGYLINRKAAEALIRAHGEYSFVADDWSFVLKKSGINAISYYDVVIHPIDLSNSTIEAERKK